MKQQERGVLSMVREALAAEKSDAQRVPALLMELKTAAATADQEAKSQSAAEQLARKRVAEADDELRALKYQRAQIVRQLAKSQGGGNARDVDAQTISAQDAQRCGHILEAWMTNTAWRSSDWESSATSAPGCARSAMLGVAARDARGRRQDGERAQGRRRLAARDSLRRG